MKVETLKLDGKKSSIEVTDKIFSAKINKKLVSAVLYKTMLIIKNVTQKPSNKMKFRGPHQKSMLKKELVMLDTQVKKLQFLLVVE